jgi:hypothetical protein
MKLILTLLVCFSTMATLGQTPVRLSWQEFAQDPARVQSFRNAVAAMRALNTSPDPVQFRRSWVYWASMHGYFGQGAKNGTVAQWREANGLTAAKYDAAFAGVENTTPPDAVAQAVWDQCQHGTDYFFPWHRLYLHYFEQVLQRTANDPALRLPYWDYTNPANLAMPPEFTSPTYTNAQGQVVDNPLFERRRAPGWNTPGGKTLNSTDTNIDQTLDNPLYLNTTDDNGDTVNGYQRAIELTPHGYAHCAVIGCRATVMGAVPFSANDPIFYVHHANIDRMWDCWTSIAGHVNPGGAWLTQPFSFVDATGTQVTNLVSDVFKPGFIDYVYQQPSNCARPAAAPVSATATATTARPAAVRSARAALVNRVLIGEETTDLAVNAPLVRQRVTLPATASLAHPRQFALRAQPELPVATDLTLRRVRFDAHPNAEFRVYLERTDNPTAREFVGTLSFFSQEPAGSQSHHAPTSDTWTFNVTDALRALGLEGTGTLSLNVVIEVEEDDAEDFDANRTGLVIDEIELHVRRDL